ncbi:hypothetical protein SLS63_003718 [Diaporthe eres]|uniref:Uncharacterized protein n=1 Tax=Diaporthe eres TaxID=83184 RepID=A0ABR1PFX3_DIAER
MGIIVRMLGSGLGMASEAIQSAPIEAEAPPEYVEVADEATANQLVRSGKAERVSDYADDKKRQSKASEAGYPDDDDGSSSDDDSDIIEVNDEAAWELDDMAERVAAPSYAESEADLVTPATSENESEESKVKKEEQMIRDLLGMAGPPPQPTQRIPCPVIIPQRRPRNKDRGFVRAYAPVLDNCGVSQEVFLKFLKDWLAASQLKSDPWIDIIFIAAGVVGFVPELATQIVSTVVQVVAGTAKELQSRSRRNTFLDRVNQELFMPRGLYALVMAFKDEVPGQQPRGPLSKLANATGKALFSAERLDINQTVAKYSNPDTDMSKLKKGMQNIRLVSGKTHGEIELPEAAALVFPDLDRAADTDLNQQGKGKEAVSESTKEKWKGAGKWVQDYLDRKAQASYEREHQGSSLAVPADSRPAFSSRFSDPNHPANSGSLISLLTGGSVNPAASRQERRAARQDRRALKREYKDQRRMARGRAPRGPRQPRRPKGQRKKGIIKKILQQDVLYLLIVNLPTEQEAIEANSQLIFQIIINPDSGPGSPTPGDSDEYIAGVTRLNSYSNVQLFGYVHCNYDTSSGDEINRNVTQWNSWNADPKISIDGIFYDEIPNEEDDGESVAFLASLVKAAQSTFGDRPFQSIFNPGATPEHIELYDSADYIVVFESEASSYNEAVLANQIPPGKASQSSILIYDFADQGDDGQLRTWLQGMVSAGVGSADILNTGYSEANDDSKPAGIGTVASILSSGGGHSAAKLAHGTEFATSRVDSGGNSSPSKSRRRRHRVRT